MSKPITVRSPLGTNRRRDTVAAIALTAALAAASSFLWYRIQVEHRERVDGEVRVIAELVGERIESFLEERIRAARFLASKWRDQYAGDPEGFRRDAGHLIDRLPALQALNWVDAEGVIRIVVPTAGNQAALGADLGRHQSPSVRRALQLAARGSPHRTDSFIQFLQGGRGFASYFPVQEEDGSPGGFVNAVFRVEEVLEASLPASRLGSRFRFAVAEGENVISIRGEVDSPVFPSSWAQVRSVPVEVLDRPWTLYVAPTSRGTSSIWRWDRWPLLALVLASAASIGVLFASVVHGRSIVRSRERLVRSLLESAAEGIYGLDLAGRCTFVNRAAVAMLGYEEDREVLGRRMHALTHHSNPDDTPLGEGECELQRSLREGRAASIRTSLWRRDGSSFDAEVESHPVFAGSELTGAVVTFRDVTERLVMEAQLLRAQKMESIGLLAGGIAHDFNNHLTVILGNAELARKALTNQAEVDEALRAIVTSSRLAAGLTGQLMAYAGRGTLKVCLVDLDDVVRDITALLRTNVPKKSRLDVESAGGPHWIRGDESRLSQVVMNLVTNATEALAGSAGTVEIRTGTAVFEGKDLPRLVWGKADPGTYRFLRVRDDGVGMSSETLTRFFDPFFTTKATGRGLGLSVVAGIVEAHRGGIVVESAVGRGTTVTVLLPAAEPTGDELSVKKASVEPVEPPALEGRERNRGMALIVDDEAAVRRFVAAALREEGFEVVEAADGMEGVDRFRAAAVEIRLVVLDLQMPQMNGEEAYEAIRKLAPDVPVLFSTGYRTETVAARVDADPRSRLLAKPYRLDELRAAIREVGEPVDR